VIVTPHHGEFSRLLSPSFTGTLEEKLMAFSNRYQLTTILKGPQTLICNGSDLLVSSAAGPVLARGGSGDILSGMLLARFAVQTDDPMQAAIEAVTWHSAAANALAQETGAIATRTTGLLPYIGHVLREG
jgi:NAD(P)H-hydrate epimerase